MDLDIVGLLMRAPVVLFSLTIHEYMHAWTAWKCGDDTALRQGRITLNPLAHLDPIGTIALFIGPIGWARPVPVNPLNFNNPRRDGILVSGAGVAANFAFAAICALALRFSLPHLAALGQAGLIVSTMVLYACFMNFGLAVFNLLPIPPLDGSHILRELLPGEAAMRLARVGPYAALVLLAIVVANRVMHFPFLGYQRVTPLGLPVLLLMHLFAGRGIAGIFFGA